MQRDTLLELFRAGDLVRAKVVQTTPDDYVLQFERQNGNHVTMSYTREPGDKLYKSTHTAAFDANKLGFKNVEVCFA